MSKYELALMTTMGTVLIALGWVDDGGWLHRLALIWGGVMAGAVLVDLFNKGE